MALLRAVNVGGTGLLAMEDLRRLALGAGLLAPRTYIASGNLVFGAEAGEAEVKAALEAALLAHAGRPVGVLVRTAAEMAEVRAANPFPDARPNRTVAIFLDAPPPRDALATVANRTTEEIALGRRELYVAYGDSMGRSRLRIPAAESGTARNMNTVARLTEMAAAWTPPPA